MAASTSHPGSSYYVSPTGTIQAQSNPIAAAALKAAGYTGPYDWTDAKKVASEGLGAKIGQIVGAGVGDVTSQGITNQGTRSGTAVSGAAAGAKAENALKDVLSLSGISGTNLAIRIAKVVIGGILLIVGLVEFTGLTSKAPAIVKTAVKAAPFL